jgi:hypothetical protein
MNPICIDPNAYVYSIFPFLILDVIFSILFYFFLNQTQLSTYFNLINIAYDHHGRLKLDDQSYITYMWQPLHLFSFLFCWMLFLTNPSPNKSSLARDVEYGKNIYPHPIKQNRLKLRWWSVLCVILYGASFRLAITIFSISVSISHWN